MAIDPGTLVSGVPVTLEIGRRRSFAQAVDWPGWCRAGRDENLAVANLAAYADRYRAADVTTDFGAPGQTVPSDRRPLAQGEPERLAAFLDACWAAFDAALAATPEEDRPVKPQVGRSPDTMRTHILDALRAYATWLSKPVPRMVKDDQGASETVIRGFVREHVVALPVGVPFEDGKRTGPYAVRRECWHVLDHAWELEDRLHAT